MLLCLICVVTWSAAAAAGTGVKYDTNFSEGYSAAGLDLEFGLPGIPLSLFTDLVGWWGTEDQVTHAQAGAGARFFLGAGAGLFVEGKFHYIFEFGEDAEPSSTAVTAGVGYRLRPALIGSIDLAARTRLGDHHLLPQYTVGLRFGF